MSSQRYEPIAANDHDDAPPEQPSIPHSPPPSFVSVETPRNRCQQTEEEQTLHDTFDSPSDDESDDENARDRRQLLGNDEREASENDDVEEINPPRPGQIQRRVTEIPIFPPPGGRVIGGGNAANDGVFANITAKPKAGEDLEEKPPTYEQAAADATPPYWETTVLSPYSHSGNPDDVFVDGLLVGSLFSFIWNALISMSFQLIGFLLTYLLHTTHAAKHGSRAGLGITLVQYGFNIRSARTPSTDPGVPEGAVGGIPQDPDEHDFDPSQVSSGSGAMEISTSDWLSYVLMIVGWFILIRAVSDFLRARRQEALVRSSPDRGLGVAVVAEGESPETSA